jgi:formylmethanofuran dehydrogenase subunit E
MYNWKNYVERATAFHGHLCSGQILGLRLALAGMRALGLTPGENYRNLVLFLETDRCMADAAVVVTGVTPGKRRLKFIDYGKAAVSFLDLETDKAVRVAGKAEPRPTEDCDPVTFWSQFKDEDILTVEEVQISLPPQDRPGKSKGSAICQNCGELINDMREVTKEGRILCRACAGTPYYRTIGQKAC